MEESVLGFYETHADKLPLIYFQLDGNRGTIAGFSDFVLQVYSWKCFKVTVVFN